MTEFAKKSDKLGKVLCVDDEPSILRSLQWLLKKDFDVVTATSGHEGLEAIRNNDFDVIISDQRMPGMMGSEFLREARKISPRSMRILLTGYSDLQAILRSVNDGEVFRFVNKPWSIKELPKTIADAAEISKNNSFAPSILDISETSKVETGDESILLIDDDPLMKQLILDVVGQDVKITQATTLAEAISAFNDQNIGVILSDTRINSQDTTTLLKVLKHDHPSVVTVVYTAMSDAVNVVNLINQGQIFRFIPKPVKALTLRLALVAAALKRRQLLESPDTTKRYSVEVTTEVAKEEMLRTLELSIPNAGTIGNGSTTSNQGGLGILKRLGGSFSRFFSSDLSLNSKFR